MDSPLWQQGALPRDVKRVETINALVIEFRAQIKTLQREKRALVNRLCTRTYKQRRNKCAIRQGQRRRKLIAAYEARRSLSLEPQRQSPQA